MNFNQSMTSAALKEYHRRFVHYTLNPRFDWARAKAFKPGYVANIEKEIERMNNANTPRTVNDRVAIFDIDGCISDDEWRRGRIPEGAKAFQDYAHYHAACGQDAVLEFGGKVLLDHIRANDFIAFITARPLDVAKETCEWIVAQFAIQPNKDFMILMREPGENASAVDVKKRLLEYVSIYCKDTGRKVCAAYDDRADIIEMYRQNGIPNAKIMDKGGFREFQMRFDVAPQPDATAVFLGRIEDRPELIKDRAGVAAEDIQEARAFILNTEAGTTGEQVEQATQAVYGKIDPAKFLRVPADVQDAASILESAAATFRERNANYRDNAFVVGQVMQALFPNGVSLQGAEDFHVWHLFELIIVKLTRFTQSGLTHTDSIRDLAVYAAMVESILAIHNIDTHQDDAE
jgi:hypothetical protein